MQVDPVPMLPPYQKEHKRGGGLKFAAWMIVGLLALNTLLLGTLVSGLVLVFYRAEPILAAIGPDDVRRVTSALRAADESELIPNVGSLMSTISNLHFLPSNVISTAYAILGMDVGTFAKDVASISGPALQAVQ